MKIIEIVEIIFERVMTSVEVIPETTGEESENLNSAISIFSLLF
jgi:hypothetical protein